MNNKMVKCPACCEAYNLDLNKYGGKKIKCKKCQATITVPTISQAQDEFEVVDDDLPPEPARQLPVPPQPLPASLPPSILQRNRMASQRGAVNIALLQRNEGSREEIREAFLEVHGSKGSRLPDSILPLISAEEEIDAQLAESEQAQAKVSWLKDVLARAIASTGGPFLGEKLTGSNNILGTMLAGAAKFEKRSDEEAYSYALSIVGRPVREIPVATANHEISWSTFKAGFTDAFTGKFAKDLEARQAEVRAIKMDTIKAAIEISENSRSMLLAEKANIERDQENAIAEHSKTSKSTLARAKAQMLQGELSEATHSLQDLLNSAPIQILGQVLVALSQCTFLSGNASNAARHIQDAICFGASAPIGMDEGYNDLWAKSSAGLPKS